jgi:hypothetical protein
LPAIDTTIIIDLAITIFKELSLTTDAVGIDALSHNRTAQVLTISITNVKAAWDCPAFHASEIVIEFTS